jgi:hypothetical protein
MRIRNFCLKVYEASLKAAKLLNLDAPKFPKIVCVTKGRTLTEILTLENDFIAVRKEFPWLGEFIIGENYLQEFSNKDFPSHYKKHFIGPLQSNKVRKIIQSFDTIQSVGKRKVLDLALEELSNINAPEKTFMLQVNISNDPNKSGYREEEVFNEISYGLLTYPHFKDHLSGLMAIPALYENSSQKVSEDFKRMARLRDLLERELSPHLKNVISLSMGMSNDFEEGILAGADMIRVGSLLFP